MAMVGYARVSTAGQSLNIQLEELKAKGCDKIFSEKKSGLDGARPELARCLEYVREGDVLLVSKLDRLARSTADFYSISQRLKAKGVGFRCLDNLQLDTTTKVGKLTLGLLALIAEFETAIRKERQLEGIEKAKEVARLNGKSYSRPPKLTSEQVAELRKRRKAGDLIKDLMRDYRLSKASVYRMLTD